MRFPQEHAAPITRASIVTDLVPAAADARFDYCVHRPGFTDLVRGERPPSAHLLGENAPSDFRRRLHAHDLPHAVRLVSFKYLLFVHNDFLSCFLASPSAASLNASSALSQKPSSQVRSVSRPCAFTA